MFISGFRVAPVIVAAMLTTALTAQGQPQSVQGVFEKYKLLGVFAGECTKPISKQNPYAVYRLLDANGVQYDLMTSPTDRAKVGVLDTAVVLSPSDVSTSYAGERGRIDIIYRVEANRFRLWASTRQNGEKLVVDGRYTPENVVTPWLNRCG